MKSILFLTLLCLASCSSNPYAQFADGSKLWMGGGFLENSADESGDMTMPNGFHVTYHKTGKNQTSGPAQLMGYWGLAQASKNLYNAKNVTTQTNGKVALGAQKADVTKTLGAQQADVTKTISADGVKIQSLPH